MTNGTKDLVSVFVPKEHLTAVYGFIATLDGVGESGTEGQLDKEAASWTPDLIRRQYIESPDTIKRFEKLLADHPEEWFSTADIAARLKASKGSKTIAGALGAFGRRTSNRYQMKTWPFQNQWNHAEGQQYYSMNSDVAEIITAL